MFLSCGPSRGVASFARSGGAKLKSGGQRFSPNFSGRNHRFSDQKQVISKKKKKKKRSSPKSEGFFWPKSQIFTRFFRPVAATSSSQKNSAGGKKKIGRGETIIGGALPPPLATRLGPRFAVNGFQNLNV